MQLKKLFAALAVSGGLVFTLAGCGDKAPAEKNGRSGSDRRRRIEDRRFARAARRHHQLRRAYAGEGRRKGQSD